MATDTDNEPTEPTADAIGPPCPVCGAMGGFIHLDDGTTYCPAHKGLAAIVDTPDVTTAEPAPSAPLPTEHEIMAEAPSVFEPEADTEPPWPMDPGVRMVAGLALDAALATFHADQTYGDPPLGWAPPPADQSPHMEAGVALALGTLIEATECDREVIQALADALCGRTPTTEGTEHD